MTSSRKSSSGEPLSFPLNNTTPADSITNSPLTAQPTSAGFSTKHSTDTSSATFSAAKPSATSNSAPTPASSSTSSPVSVHVPPPKARKSQLNSQLYTLPPLTFQQNLPPRMNPASPSNGSPFVPSHSNIHPFTSSSTNPQHPQSGPVQQAHPAYGIPHVQHYQGYPYSTYPSHPMMYQHPPQSTSVPPPPPPASTSPVSSTPATGGKRKRKTDSVKGKNFSENTPDTEDASQANVHAGRQPSSPFNTTATPMPLVDMHKKRTKTQRACDSCRSRKIRCDILSDGSDHPICQHCKQYGFECTFFLPITETRFKKKRLEEEAANIVTSSSDKEKPTKDPETPQRSPHSEQPKGEVRIYGPTSMTHLLHSTATVPPRVYQNYDLRYNHTWEVSKTGDGFIQVLEPQQDDSQQSLAKPIDFRIERDIIEKLVNLYFSEVSPLLPVLTETEFLSHTSPPPILLYSICLVAAARRDVPQPVFESLRLAVSNIIKSEDVLSSPSIVNVQSLLILCQCADCHSHFVPSALSALWLRLGTAIRMAQDLGLHRAEAVKQNIETRRRLWGACVIMDRWMSLLYGHPFMIDVQDCDARLPSSGDPNDQYTDEFVRLSIILGRVLKTIYAPAGLNTATDESLHELLRDMMQWRENLPEALKFRGRDSARSAGVLHILFSCVLMIFWRVFMRISYSCPAHLKFNLTIDQWTELVHMCGDAIEWLDANEQLYDIWMMIPYAITSCALVQYHTWARRKDVEAQVKLRILRDCVKRWENSLPPEHMSTRRKTAEVIILLYEATQGPHVPDEETPVLNPTSGVRSKLPSSYKGLVFKNDPSRPGGGVFVAHGKAKQGDYTNIAEGTIVLNGTSSDEESEGEDLEVEASLSTRLTNNSSRSSINPGIAATFMISPQPSNEHGQHGNLLLPTSAASNYPPPPPQIVNYAPLGGHIPNVNPFLNQPVPNVPDVHVLNVLDVPPQAPYTLEQFAAADTGYLEGLPGPSHMFDWPQWEIYFARFSNPDPNTIFQQQNNRTVSANGGGPTPQDQGQGGY